MRFTGIRFNHGPLWAVAFLALVVTGCSTTDKANTSERPWNQPTGSDVSKDWWFYSYEHKR
jgi:hypothetical protein